MAILVPHDEVSFQGSMAAGTVRHALAAICAAVRMHCSDLAPTVCNPEKARRSQGCAA